MFQSRCAVAALALLASLVPTSASAHPASARPAGVPDRINLPLGWQPEGITTDGRYLYAGSLADGALWRANPRTGTRMILEDGSPGRMAVGIDYDRRRDLLWVAGGDTSELRAHDADTGRVRARYTFEGPARFLNDLVVTPRAVYATDSVNQELAVVPLRKDRRLPRPHVARTQPLTGDLQYEAGFNLNGIVASHGRLLAVQSNTGMLFRIHPGTGRTRTVDLDGVLLTNGDGLELDRDLLYVVRNQDNEIAVVDLGRHLGGGEVFARLTDSDFDVPTTVALVGHSLWAVNARFGTDPTPRTSYWVTRLRAFH
jgi:sugar lactone lactonase YvrE